MKFIIYEVEGNIKMRISNATAYQALKDSLEPEQLLVDNGEWSDREWPCDDDMKQNVMNTFERQLKGKGFLL